MNSTNSANDIDAQLKAKFKLFNDIDKLANQDPYSTIKSNNSNKNYNKNQIQTQQPIPSNYYESPEVQKKVTGERYNDYYDNNNENENNTLNYARKPSNSTLNTGPNPSNKQNNNSNKNVKNFNTGGDLQSSAKKNSSNSLLGGRQTNSSTKESKSKNIKEKIVKEKTKEKNLNRSLTNNFENNVSIFNSLYDRGQAQLAKQREKSEERDEMFKRMASPKINKKSEQIVRESSKYNERLFPLNPKKINSEKLVNHYHNNNYNNNYNNNFFNPLNNKNFNRNEEIKINKHNSYNEFEYILDNVNKFSKYDLERKVLNRSPIEEKDYNDNNLKYNNAPPKCFKDYGSHNQYVKNISKQDLASPNNFNFKPKICKNSEKIANKLESSFERLTRPRKKKSNPLINSPKSYFYNSIDSEQSLNRSNQSTSKFSRSFDMYKDEFRRQEKLKNLREDFSKADEEKLKSQTPFKPTSYTSNYKSRGGSKGVEFNERQSNWQKKVELKDQKTKEVLFKKNNAENTFNPNLQKKKLKDDEKNIVKIVDQSNLYVNRRQKCIKKQKEDEEYFNKRMVVNPNFKLHVTKPADVKISSSGSYEFMERLKRSKHCHTPDILNKARNDLKTNYFFNKESYDYEN